MAVSVDAWSETAELPRPSRVEYLVIIVMVAAVAALPFLVIAAGNRTHAAAVEQGQNVKTLGSAIGTDVGRATDELIGAAACQTLRDPRFNHLTAREQTDLRSSCAVYRRSQVPTQAGTPTG
jgi:hypothetical protein